MGTTPKFGWPYPEPSDLVRDAPEAFQDLADAIEDSLGGTILQVVQTVKTDAFTTSSATMTDLTGVSASITPTSASSKVLAVLTGIAGAQNTGSVARVNLVRGSTAIAQSTGAAQENQSTIVYTATSTAAGTFNVTFLDSPSTTSSTTYKAQVAVGGNATTIVFGRTATNDNFRAVTTLTLFEVAG